MRRTDLFVSGDVMTGRGVDQLLAHPSDPRLHEPYVKDARDYVSFVERQSGLLPRPVAFDYVWGDALVELRRRAPQVRIVNLETSVTGDGEPDPFKDIHYRMSPRNLPCLTAAEIDVCVLANNHVLDWGVRGLEETLDVLREGGIATAGAGRDEVEAFASARVELGGDRRVLVTAAADTSSGVPSAWSAGPARPGVAVLPDLGASTAASLSRRATVGKGAEDVAVVSIHWGPNWGYEIPEEHVRFAHALVDGGVDLVHGHSSHHAKAIELYAGKAILYGCGDLLSDYEGISGHERFRGDLSLLYFPSFDARGLARLEAVPMRTRRVRLERGSPDEARWLAETLRRESRAFGTDVALEDGCLVVRELA